jgi:modulator of FtsH protease HflC
MDKTQNFLVGVIAVTVLAIFILSQSLFTVDEREQAIVLQLGEPVGELRGPGLHFKIPVVQDVRRFDRRILAVDPPPEQVVIASTTVTRPAQTPVAQPEDVDAELSDNPNPDAPPPIQNVSGEPIIVDSFARYRITDPLQFLKTLRDVAGANDRLENILDDAARGILGRTTLKELLSEDRTQVMSEISALVNERISRDQLGIEIVDVRIVRADLTAELRDSTVRRMISELRERATETRALGEERALEIRSTADKERAIILAEAAREAQVIRGEGDNEAIKIYADAFNKDKEFYGFIRSLEAYRATLADQDTRLILSPDSDFFRFFQNRTGR